MALNNNILDHTGSSASGPLSAGNTNFDTNLGGGTQDNAFWVK